MNPFFSSSVILEAVVSSVAILSSNKTSRAQKEQFDWPMPLNVATQVPEKVLHCATWKKTDFYFSQRLRQQKVARNVCSRVCYTRQYFVQLVSQEKLPSVTVLSATVATIFLSITKCNNLSSNGFRNKPIIMFL